MPLIEWKDAFKTGVASVDYEHEQLIDFINGIHQAIKENRSKEIVADFLAELYAGISSHFAHEEQIMREKRYVEYSEHKADHERLLDEIRDIMDRHFNNGYIDDGDPLGTVLLAWFTEHFRTMDARLHGYFRE